MLLDSVKPGDPKMPTHGNEDSNVMRYPARDRCRQKCLNDCKTGEQIDDVIDDITNCTIDFCHRSANVPSIIPR